MSYAREPQLVVVGQLVPMRLAGRGDGSLLRDALPSLLFLGTEWDVSVEYKCGTHTHFSATMSSHFWAQGDTCTLEAPAFETYRVDTSLSRRTIGY